MRENRGDKRDGGHGPVYMRMDNSVMELDVVPMEHQPFIHASFSSFD